ncbi:hypothetical protein ACO2RV_12660 [Ancylobacter sp. VNQ12]|uniref:hypothetical protein n=1 Tax=Ancylobacter sp. VNQ12 TaxID=3400920 RepID=UPI003C054CFA
MLSFSQTALGVLVAAVATFVSTLFPTPLGMPYLEWVGTKFMLGFSGYLMGLYAARQSRRRSYRAKLVAVGSIILAFLGGLLLYVTALANGYPGYLTTFQLFVSYAAMVMSVTALCGFAGLQWFSKGKA